MRADLTIAGVFVFAAAWLPAVVIGASGGSGCDGQSCRDALDSLPIPVLGPVIAAAQAHNMGWYVWPWSLAQAGGVAMLVAGLIGHDVPADPDKSTVTIMPTASPHAAGFVLHARF